MGQVAGTLANDARSSPIGNVTIVGAGLVGSLLAWPSLVTHPHEALPLRSGVKHALTIWFELPADYERLA